MTTMSPVTIDKKVFMGMESIFSGCLSSADCSEELSGEFIVELVWAGWFNVAVGFCSTSVGLGV
jgi:hypothetical protein